MIKQYKLYIANLTCASCIEKIKAIANTIPEVSSIEINFATKISTISGKNLNTNNLIKKLKNSGYNSTLITNDDTVKSEELIIYNKLLKKFIIAGIFGIAVLILNFYPIINNLILLYIIAIISCIIIYYSGGDIYKRAFSAFLNHTATMDTLITIGTLSAWMFSLTIIINPTWFQESYRHTYFDAALIIIALVNLGAALEIKTKGKTSAAIRKLIKLQPKTAIAIINNTETEINISDITKNIILRARSGEQLAVDGYITDGEATINEAMLTGESMPLNKTLGNKVYSGTIIINGTILYKATEVGQKTILAKIIKLIDQAQNTKPNIAKLADIIASYFVPIAIIIAVLTAMIWYNLTLGTKINLTFIASMTVLIIACPCALGLATPISVIAGIGKAAEYGILIRNGSALQETSKLNTIVFDKTGTLTTGVPTVTNIISFAENYSHDDILKYAASLEQGSTHPLGIAIITYAKKKNITLLKLNNFTNLPGSGITGTISTKQIIIGNQKIMRKNNILISKTNLAKYLKLANLGNTCIYIAINNNIAGLISIKDQIKPQAKTIIKQLENLKINLYLLTGDNKITANAVGAQLGFKKNNIIAEVMPRDKINFIKQLQENNNHVGMVGDGINDSPALTQANVGFAIGSGSDIAIESADITLIKNTLTEIPQAIKISNKTMRNIKQNLFGAFIYNILGIPIAAGVLYPIIGMLLNPIIACIAMTLSSLTVISNANRLRWIKL